MSSVSRNSSVATRTPPAPSLTSYDSVWAHPCLPQPSIQISSDALYTPDLAHSALPPLWRLLFSSRWLVVRIYSILLFFYTYIGGALILLIEMNNKSPQYDTVWSADHPDQEELLSETDVEEGHEKQWHSDEKPTRRRGKARQSWATLKAHRGLIDTSLLLVIIGLLSLLLLRRPQQPETIQIGGDYMGAGPECQFPSRAHACTRAHDV